MGSEELCQEVWAPGKIELNHKLIANIYPATKQPNHKTPPISRKQSIANINNTKPIKNTSTAVFDSGATSHCGRIGDEFTPTNEASTKIFHLPNGQTTAATNKAKLKLDVREPARTVDMVPELKHNSLISASKFVDANYITILTPTEVLIYDGDGLKLEINHDAILRGWREASGLWRVPLSKDAYSTQAEYVLLSKETEEAISNVYELPSIKESIRYLHACAGFPTKATWLKAIRAGNYATWPNLTAKAVAKYFPESDETQQGHMRNIKQGLRSTKERKQNIEIKQEDGSNLTLPLPKHNDVYVRIDEAKETIYTDQTGAFPVRSRNGSRYIMIMCEMDSNSILSEAMKDRTAGEIIKAYQKLIKRLRRAGIKPKKHILDNECSNEYKEAIEDNGMNYELVPKGQHRRNIAEKAIQTWKAHAIGVYSGMSEKCPLAIWDLLLP